MKKSDCIMSAAKEGNVETLKSLLGEKQTWISKVLGRAITANIVNRDGWCPLHFAAQNGKVSAISFLLGVCRA